jgi:hypothetical protein
MAVNYNNWSKTISSTIQLSKKNPSQGQLHLKAKRLAKKYYGTEDLGTLQSYQLDKIIGWVTDIKPNKGSNKDRRHGRTLGRYIKGKL